MDKRDILIIDDSALWVERLSGILKSVDGVEKVMHAASYTEALPLLDMKPHFVFLDIHLPGKNGVELLRFMKKNYPTTVVCVVSNQVNGTVKELCREIGADEFLDKSKEFNMVPEFILNYDQKRNRGDLQ